MPGPVPRAPGQPQKPKEEEFETLIADLTGEFRKLRQRVSDLATENGHLRAKLDPDGHTRADPAEPRPKLPIVASSELDCHAGESQRQAICDGSDDHSEWASETAGEGAKRGMSSFAQEVESRTGRFKNSLGSQAIPELQVRHHHSHQLERGGSSLGLRASITRKIDMALMQSCMFEKLDSQGKGLLTIQDLLRILSSADEAVEYDVLVNVVRLMNGLAPLEAQEVNQDFDAIEMQGRLGLDLHAFQRLMDPDFELREPFRDALERIRGACESESHHHRKAARTTVIGLPKNAAEDASFFQRHAPCILETVPPIVILLNAVVVGIAADHPDLENVWDACEYAFFFLYTMEFLMKLRLLGCRGYFQGPDRYWNWFDIVCLALSLGDSIYKIVSLFAGDPNSENSSGGAAFTMIKILRLSRLARLVRTLRFKIFAELKMMVMGVVSGLRVLTWAIILLLMLVYLVGVATTNLLQAEVAEFATMTRSMSTLFRCWTEGCAAYDGTPLSEHLLEKYGWLWLSFHVLMTMFITVGLFNLIMATFIDNVLSGQQLRKHIEMVERSDDVERRFKQLFALFIKSGTGNRTMATPSVQKLSRVSHRMMQSAGVDLPVSQVDWNVVEKEWEVLREMDIVITKEVFNDWLEDPKLQQLLDDAEIDLANRSELFDVLDCDMGGQLSMDELTTGLMKLRGAVTKSDIVAIRLKVRYLISIMEVIASSHQQPHRPSSRAKQLSTVSMSPNITSFV